MTTTGRCDVLPLLSIRRSDDEGVPILALAGEIDMSNVCDVEAAAQQHAAGRFVIDLSEVTFIDSRGLHALLRVNERHRDGTLAMCAPEGGAFRRLLSTVGLDGVVQVFPTRDAAVAQIR